MKQLFTFLALLAFGLSASGQYMPITNFAGTATYGSRTITVTSAGSILTYADPCLGPPTLYWAGQTGPGDYLYTISSPVYSIYVDCDYLNSGTYGAGEYLSMYINGVFYPLTAANMSSYNVCGSGGPSYLYTGFLMGPNTAGFAYNGGTFTINSCAGIHSFEIYCNGIEAGVTWHVSFDSVFPCSHAINNSPCLGDTLKLDEMGDSSGAVYSWTGPGGFTSTLQDPFIAPSVFADSGWYYCIKVAGLVTDTDSTHVVIYPLPVLNLANNAPLCTGLLDTLRLSCIPDSVGETFSWTGPNSFTSTLENPTVPGFLPIDTGFYTVTATTVHGCKSTATIDAGVVPPPPPPTITGKIQYCYGDPFVPFTVTAVGSVLWYPTLTSTIGSTTPPVVSTTTPGTFTYYANQTIGSCESPMASITVTVYPQIVPSFSEIYHRGCNSDEVFFINNSTGSTAYQWHFGDLTGVDPLTSPSHIFATQNIYTVTLLCYGINPTCTETATGVIDTRHSVTAAFNSVPDTICLGQSITMNNTSSATVNIPVGTTSPGVITAYAWNFGDGNTDVTAAPTHTFTQAGIFTSTLVVTDSIHCTSQATESIFVLQVGINSFHDTLLCLSQPLALKNEVILTPAMNLPFTYQWSTSANLSDSTVQIPNFNAIGLFTYTFTATVDNFGCFATDVITINSVLGAPLTNVTPSTTIPYGTSIQLNADNEVFYHWIPWDGSLNNPNLNNPIATPEKTTLYTVYGYDVNICLDSAYVLVNVDSTMTEDIPTGFTPNGDGLNDVFRVVGLKYQDLVDFRVYNRWGQQVFYTNNYKDGWDGTFNGVKQDMGTYFYTIIVARPGGAGNDIVYKGEVTLIR
jgi:gliding motility-associated-like protein